MNELTRPTAPYMTASEFLVWPGDGSYGRSHLVDGEVQNMSPASWVHGRIQINLAFLLETAARASGPVLSVVAEGAVIPALTASDNVRVPDLLVTRAGEAMRGEIAVPDPVAVVEILSPGNAPATRGNVRAYATLASVQEIVVVSTSRLEVEVYRRKSDGAWLPESDVIIRGGQLAIHTVDLICPVEDVYRGTWLFGSQK